MQESELQRHPKLTAGQIVVETVRWWFDGVGLAFQFTAGAFIAAMPIYALGILLGYPGKQVARFIMDYGLCELLPVSWTRG